MTTARSSSRNPRQRKTPRQRAQEQLDATNRLVVRLDRKVDALKADLAILEREHREAVARQQYLRQHPDLSDTPIPGTDAGTTDRSTTA